jgi:hypothetical protein
MTLAVNIAQSGSNNVTFRNKIINGAMVIDQRNAGASVTPTATGGSGTYTLDRWNLYISQASKLSIQQNAGAVTPPTGFGNYLGATSLSSYSIGASDYFFLYQAIEGFNTSDLAWGTASASTITLSFWVRSSLTGTFGGSLRNSAANRSYPFTYTISSANTWEQKSITVVGDTSGTWVGATNGIGMYVQFGLGVGSSLSGTAGAWAGSNYLSATGATSVVGTNGATFYITGVQLEAGTTASPFEYRQYGTELYLCQRYYAKLGANASGSANYQAYGAGHNNANNTSQDFHLPFPQFMRATPTIALSGSIGVSANGSYINVNSIGGTYAGVSSCLLQTNTGAIGSAGQGAVLLSNADNTAYISLSAEL